METIIKYRNRKLYLKGTGCYVDLAYIKDLVRNNKSFEVVTFDEGRDVTANTLKQVILNVDANRDSLEDFIRSSR